MHWQIFVESNQKQPFKKLHPSEFIPGVEHIDVFE